MEGEGPTYLELADWRRQVATLYAEVRALAAADPAAALTRWRTEREHLYRDHPQSPLPACKRAEYRARHFPHDPALRFEVAVIPSVAASTAGANRGVSAAPTVSGPATGADAHELPSVHVPASTGESLVVRRIGWVDIPFPAGERRLALFWLLGYAGGLYLPFRDTTNGVETYGAGRYLLDGAKSADLGGDAERGTLILDFNFAYHPSCAFDPRWSCPLAPPENRLDLPIRAGERLD